MISPLVPPRPTQIRLRRYRSTDLVFVGTMLAEAVVPPTDGHERRTYGLYTTHIGKIVLAKTITTILASGRSLHKSSILCFSCVADIDDYFREEDSKLGHLAGALLAEAVRTKLTWLAHRADGR